MRTLAIITAALAALIAPATLSAATSAAQQAEVEKLERELAEIDALVGAAAAEANRAIDRAEEIEVELRTTRQELRRNVRDLATTRERLEQRLRALYVRPEPDLGVLLLSGAPLETIVAARQALDTAAQQDRRTVDRVRERRATLVTLRADLARQSVEAERDAERAAAARDQVQRRLRERQKVLNGARSELKRLLAAERAARAATAAQHSTGRPVQAASAPPISLPGGSHIFPVAGPTQFTDDWLYPRPGGRYHEGIDLFAERGTPLVAVADGTVYRVGWNTLGGWRFWLRDTGGTTYYYAHLESFAPAAQEGASVSAGTVLGYMGDSGSARGTGVHLHFEIHPGGGAPVRPWPYVTSWPRAG